MELTRMGIVIDIDDLSNWEEASASAAALLTTRCIHALEQREHTDKVSHLIVNALRRIVEQTCTIYQAQRMMQTLIASWDLLRRGPVWQQKYPIPGIDRMHLKQLIVYCEDIVSENRAAYIERQEAAEMARSQNKQNKVEAQEVGRPGSRTVRISVKNNAASKKVDVANPLKNFKVQVQRTSYGELTIPAYNEEDAIAIASGEKRMYDGKWAHECFRPESHDTYLEVSKVAGAIQLEANCPCDQPAENRLEHRGYVATQSANNHHIHISKNGHFAAHIIRNEPATAEQLKAMIDNHIQLLELLCDNGVCAGEE